MKASPVRLADLLKTSFVSSFNAKRSALLLSNGPSEERPKSNQSERDLAANRSAIPFDLPIDEVDD